MGVGAEVTELLHRWRGGDQGAFDSLMELVYAELHRLAVAHLKKERPGHTLQPTDLVSEAYLRLSRGAPPEWSDRAHFFAVAARNMRQILVDHARKRGAEKRGDGEKPITLDEELVGRGRPEELLALDAALSKLAALDERKAKVIELHYFGGMTRDEIGHVLGLHGNTIASDLRMAEAWIHRYLAQP